MAEKVRVELTEGVTPRQFSKLLWKTDIHVFSMEEGEGFEPPVVLPTVGFKATALDHSATLPKLVDLAGVEPASLTQYYNASTRLFALYNLRLLSNNQTQILSSYNPDAYHHSNWDTWIADSTLQV